MKKFPQKIHVICRKIVANYEKAIRTGDFSGWKGYGTGGFCLLCAITSCSVCPLGPYVGCVHRGTTSFPGAQTYRDLMSAIVARNGEVSAARARLQYLKRRFNLAGIDLKPRKSERQKGAKK